MMTIKTRYIISDVATTIQNHGYSMQLANNELGILGALFVFETIEAAQKFIKDQYPDANNPKIIEIGLEESIFQKN